MHARDAERDEDLQTPGLLVISTCYYKHRRTIIMHLHSAAIISGGILHLLAPSRDANILIIVSFYQPR
jgi:hypothetical protein